MGSPIVGMTSLAGMGGATAALQGIHAQLTAMTAANTAAAAAVTPPGNDGASAFAMAQQQTNAAEFAAQFAIALEQMQELLVTLQAATTATAITDSANAALSAI